MKAAVCGQSIKLVWYNYIAKLDGCYIINFLNCNCIDSLMTGQSGYCEKKLKLVEIDTANLG